MRTPSAFRQGRERPGEVADQRRLGDLQFEAMGREAGLEQRLMHELREARRVQLHGRDIDRDAELVRPVAASLQADLKAHSPICRMMPLSPATGMNTPGDTSPRSGWFQRSSASKATTSPLSTRVCGW